MVALAAAHGYVAVLDREGRKRQRLLDQLAATQADLAAAEHRAGVLAERHRLARDIHDTLAQGFASVAMLLDAAQADLPPGAPPTRRVEQAMRTARENLAETRRLVHALRPHELEGAGLPGAICQLADRLSAETGIAVHTTVTGNPVALEPQVEGELLRVVQEALTNIRRHADASRVTVTLSYLDGELVLDVQDDGCGVPPGSSGGFGLATMRERINDLGGVFTVESEPGGGTTVGAVVPASAPAAEAPWRPPSGRPDEREQPVSTR